MFAQGYASRLVPFGILVSFGVRCLSSSAGSRPKSEGGHDAEEAFRRLLIAGAYTPFGFLVLSPAWAVPVLALVWSGALAGILLKLLWVRAPKWLSAAIGLGLGWVGAAAFSQLLKLQLPGVLVVVAGGLLYTAGAIVYIRRRPDPVPRVFGYHELPRADARSNCLPLRLGRLLRPPLG